MDNDNNNNDIPADYIRPPDQAIRETLVYNNYYSYNNFNQDINPDINNDINQDINDDINDDINIYDSIFIADILQQSKEEYEKELLQRAEREKEREALIVLCNGIRHKINRIKGYDVENQDIYATVLYIMDMFEMEEIINYSLKKETFDKTFYILGTLRMTHIELEFLHKLIKEAL